LRFLVVATRSGQGREEYGNLIGHPSTCPLGHKHHGNGYCVYTGNYRAGMFYGYGEFVCISGPYYKGEWKSGERHGKVSVFFCLFFVSFFLFQLHPSHAWFESVHPRPVACYTIVCVSFLILSVHAHRGRCTTSRRARWAT
jgi:hypothetical protein